MQGRAGLVGPSPRAHPELVLLPQTPKSHVLVSESLPSLPFPSLQTHLRHLSSARPRQLRRAGALGPGASAALSLWLPWGCEGAPGPPGRLNHSFHLFAPLSSHILGPSSSAPGRLYHHLLLLSSPHTQSLAGVLLVWLFIHLRTNCLSSAHPGRRLGPWGSRAHRGLSTHLHTWGHRSLTGFSPHTPQP